MTQATRASIPNTARYNKKPDNPRVFHPGAVYGVLPLFRVSAMVLDLSASWNEERDGSRVNKLGV